MEVISAINLVKEYVQGEIKVRALDDVSLSINTGSFVAVTGESGSGKSTLLNMLACMDTPTSGEVLIEGKKVPKDDKSLSLIRNRKTGMIFQAFHLLPMLTAEENIMMPGRFAGVKIQRSEIAELIDQLSLNGREKHLPSELSSGQQQRVAIGRALVNRPKILLADEPTGNLDKKSSEEIIDLLVKLKNELNMTLVVVTHSEKIAERADRRIYMEDGRIIKDTVGNA